MEVVDVGLVPVLEELLAVGLRGHAGEKGQVCRQRPARRRDRDGEAHALTRQRVDRRGSLVAEP